MENALKELVAIERNGQRVLLSIQLAKLYGCAEGRIRDNFRYAKEQFTEGVHYFKLRGMELRALKSKVGISDAALIGKFTNTLYLWTEKGAILHCKMIDTEEAWKVMHTLVDCYFAVKDSLAAEVPTAAPKTELDKLKEELSMLTNQLPKIIFAELAVVYCLLMSNGSVKIGMTQDLTARIKQIKAETGLEVFNFKSTPFMPRDEAAKFEKDLHEKYSPLRWRGEFYKARFDDVVEDLRKLCA